MGYYYTDLLKAFENICQNEKVIKDNQFKNNQLVTELCMPKVKKIGVSAFEGAINLETVYLYKSIKKIKSRAFANCYKLKDVWFPIYKTSTRIHIADDAFEGCGHITFHVAMPDYRTRKNKCLDKYIKKHPNIKIMGSI